MARPTLATDLSAGLLLAILSVNYSLSYSALLFGAAGQAAVGTGLAMMLTTSVILAVVGAWVSSIRFAVLFADGTLIAVLASVTAAVVADIRGSPPAEVTATLVATVLVATIVTGVALWIAGTVRGGAVTRYLPFQVIAGILAATGWSLTVGGAKVATGDLAPFAMLDVPALAARLGPGLLLAGTLLLAAARTRHPAALPLVIVAAIALHHAVFAGLGLTIQDQVAAGWLLALPTHLPLVPPWSPAVMANVRWDVLEAHALDLMALVPTALIAVLLGMSAIEAATGLDVTVDAELRANGLASVVCGALGGVLGIISVSRTLLVYRMGVRSWRASVFAGFAGGLLPLAWPALAGAIPRWVLGGVLLFPGLAMLQEWVVRSRNRLSWPEWLTVVAVLAVAARYGLVAGTFCGLLLGCLLFAVAYSRGSPIRTRYRGDAALSPVDRTGAERERIAAAAESLLVMHLQGFLFFGTASRLVEEIRREVRAAPVRLRCLLLDFANVDGVDGSALAGFDRLRRVMAAERIELTLTSVPPGLAHRLGSWPGPPIGLAPTLDEALERREQAILAQAAQDEPPAPLLAADFGTEEEVRQFVARLEPQEVDAGAIILRQGELSDDLLFIEHGRASVVTAFSHAAPIRVRSFGAGAMVGEIGFFLGQPRTATVVADQPCRILRLTRVALARLEVEQPGVALAFQKAMTQRLGTRLLDKDQLIAALVLDRPTRP